MAVITPSYLLHPCVRNGVEHHSGEAGKNDDYLLVLADALDDAFHAGERAFDDADTLARLVEERVVAEILDVGAGGAHADEVVHLTVGNGQYLRRGRRRDGAPHDVAEREQRLVGMLQHGEMAAGGTDKNQIVDAGDKTAAALAADHDELIAHRDEVLDAETVERCLCPEFAVISHAHGKPCKGRVCHRIQLGVTALKGSAANEHP